MQWKILYIGNDIFQIESDFSEIYPDKKDKFILTWNNFSKSILALSRRIQPKNCDEILEKLRSPEISEGKFNYWPFVA